MNFSTAVKSSSRKTRARSNCCIDSLDSNILAHTDDSGFFLCTHFSFNFSSVHSRRCADPWRDLQRVLQACILGPPEDWRWRTGLPRQSWLRSIKNDPRPVNLGLMTAKRHELTTNGHVDAKLLNADDDYDILWQFMVAWKLVV